MNRISLVVLAAAAAGCASGSNASTKPASIDIAVSGGDPSPLDPPAGAIAAPGVNAPDPCLPGAQSATGDQYRTIWSAGGLRWYWVHVPASYVPSETPVVVNVHAYTSDPFQEALLTGMNDGTDARGWITVYPVGIDRAWNAGECCGDPAWIWHVDDEQFLRDTLAAVESEWCVDPKRVFVTGMSNGGFLSHAVACDLSDEFAAAAPVAGVLGIDAASCQPSRRMPILHFHGTDDALVPYAGGGPLGFPSVPDTYAGWKQRNGCAGPDLVVYQHGDSSCVQAIGCAADTELCTVDGGGHTWPGGMPIPPLGKTTTDLDATGRMLDFFAAHPMP